MTVLHLFLQALGKQSTTITRYKADFPHLSSSERVKTIQGAPEQCKSNEYVKEMLQHAEKCLSDRTITCTNSSWL